MVLEASRARIVTAQGLEQKEHVPFVTERLMISDVLEPS